MKIKSLSVAAIIIITLVSVIAVQYNKITQIRSDRDIYKQNTYGMMSRMETLKKDSASQVYQIKALRLTIDEYKEYRSNDAKTIKDLKVRLKQAQSISKQIVEIEVPVIAPVLNKDSIRYSVFKNDYVSFAALIRNDSVSANLKLTPVEITQIVHKIPKHKFLWWRWGVKGIKQIISTNNPYVTLKYSEYIELR